jgi:hypothetical protein
MKKERKKEGRNGNNVKSTTKIDESKWDFGNRDDENGGEKKEKKGRKERKSEGRGGSRGGSRGGRGEGRGGGRSEGRGEGGRSEGGKKGEKTRPGKVKRMMQRNKKNSFTGNKGKGKKSK